MVQDEDLLLALLNSAPIIDGTPTDTLAGAKGEEFIARFRRARLHGRAHAHPEDAWLSPRCNPRP